MFTIYYHLHSSNNDDNQIACHASLILSATRNLLSTGSCSALSKSCHVNTMMNDIRTHLDKIANRVDEVDARLHCQHHPCLQHAGGAQLADTRSINAGYTLNHRGMTS